MMDRILDILLWMVCAAVLVALAIPVVVLLVPLLYTQPMWLTILGTLAVLILAACAYRFFAARR